MGRRKRSAWSVTAVSAFVLVLLFGMPIFSSGAIKEQVSDQSAPPVQPSLAPSQSPLDPIAQYCNLALSLGPVDIATYTPLGPACGDLAKFNPTVLNSINAHVAANNTAISTGDFLNITNAAVANLNATVQELLSYFEDRAESIIPYFLNQSWTQQIYDEIAIDSGLVPAIEGYELAYAFQQFQDWNATAQTWNAAFGASGQFHSTSAALEQSKIEGGSPVNAPIVRNGFNLGVTRPWQWWGTEPFNNSTGMPVYFNLDPGGTVINAPSSIPGETVYPTLTIDDLTQNFAVPVPQVNASNWANQTNIPIVSTADHIGQFDLLKLTCSANCGASGIFTSAQVSGGYAFENYSTADAGSTLISLMSYKIAIYNFAAANIFQAWVPQSTKVCVSLNPDPSGNDSCATYLEPTGGLSTATGSGPGAVAGSNRTLFSYASTMKGLVNNTMTMAYDDWVTLRALTENGTFAIPSDCSIPTPSDAFPADTDFANYQLNPLDLEVVYLSYLNSVARAYGESFTNGMEFCSDPNLALTYNWSHAWSPLLNISASVYLAGGQGPLFPNGSLDPTSQYTKPATWPVTNVDPSFLYPFDYQMDIPTNTVYAVPVNDPVAAVLMSYAGNVGYGIGRSPSWGLPTHLDLTGSGNYIQISGSLSSVGSGSSNASGDALYLSSCTLRGVPENPCNVSVTYFNNFTFGIVHGLQSPVAAGGGGGGGGGIGLTNSCGATVFNQWYDEWAGYVVETVSGFFGFIASGASAIPVVGGVFAAAIDGLGCLLAWITLIVLVVLIAVALWKIFEWARE